MSFHRSTGNARLPELIQTQDPVLKARSLCRFDQCCHRATMQENGAAVNRVDVALPSASVLASESRQNCALLDART